MEAPGEGIWGREEAPGTLHAADLQGIQDVHHKLLGILLAPHHEAPPRAQEGQGIRQAHGREGAGGGGEGLKKQVMEEAVEAGVGARAPGGGQVQAARLLVGPQKVQEGREVGQALQGCIHKTRVALVHKPTPHVIHVGQGWEVLMQVCRSSC